MKLLFHIIIILIFGYINSADAGTTVNGCGLMEYREPTSEEECKDNYEICCYIRLADSSNTKKSYCFPAPDKMDLEDVSEEILDATGYTVEALTCFDFSDHLKYMIGNLILIGLILI